MSFNKVVVCFSGGCDSTVLLYHAKRYFDKVLAVSFVYGQRHIKELELAKYHTNKLGIGHKILDISFFKELTTSSSLTNTDLNITKVSEMMGEAQPRQYLPQRNLMLLSICSAAAENFRANTILYGAALADSAAGYYDGSKEFLEQVNRVLLLNRKHKIQIEAPLIEMSKKQIIEYGIQLGVDFSKTWTCYSGEELSCGMCGACSLRLKGFIDAGYVDPLKYQIQDKLEEVYREKDCKILVI